MVMTTPLIDTVRQVPLIVEKRYEPMEADVCNSGFPFDRDDRDSRFENQLHDIAQRHPEFAEHLEGFPFRPSERRPRHDPEFRRFAERPFGTRFNRFGFNFDDPFEEDFRQETQNPPQPPQQAEPSEEPKEETRKSRNKNIQQSQTVDLGQKQEPVNDRNQRSMSAPPDNRQRYVSSIHIPINRDGGMGDMGQAQSQPQQPQEKPSRPTPNRPTERVIPIHVEGRDEPVMPKHAESERIFGHSPSHYQQYFQQPESRQRSQQPPERQVPVQKEQSQPKPQAQPQPQPQTQPQPQAPPQPQPEQQKPITPIDIIQNIQKDVSELMGQVEKFDGAPKDKQYLYLDEMLTRNLLKLDNIDTQGQENIRQARKEAIKCIQSCINILEAKAAANVAQKESQKVEEKMETESIEGKKDSEETPKGETAPVKEEEKMEIVEEEVEKQEPVEAKCEVKEEEIKEVAPVVEEKKVEEPKVEEVKEEDAGTKEQTTDEKEKGKKKAKK